MDIKARIKEKLNEMNKNDLSHADQKWIEGVIKNDKIKPQYKLNYHGKEIPLKAKSDIKAKEEAIKYASENGFKPHHADLIKYYLVNMVGRKPAKIETKILLPFTP